MTTLRTGLELPDLTEYGGIKDGVRQQLDRRLFMQLLAFGGCTDTAVVVAEMRAAPFPSVVYADLHDPTGIGLLTFGEDPALFSDELRPWLRRPGLAHLQYKPAFAMLGRTYSLGYEPDLEDTLLHRPARYVLNPEWPWAVWYPLRRTGSFSQLPEEERRAILKEHGTIGKAFGQADFVHDVRLACYGLDTNDNDFVVGLLGKALHPLSAVVETMRETRQTSQFLARLGPFFVGKAVWQSPVT